MSTPAARCHYCERPGLTRDHVVPRCLLPLGSYIRTRRWGAGVPGEGPPNVVPACWRCNNFKGNKRSDCSCAVCLAAWDAYGPANWHDWVEIRAVIRHAARQDRAL